MGSEFVYSNYCFREMPKMAHATLKERVDKLERLVEEFLASNRLEPGRDDWQATIGMFTGDGLAKEVIDEALRQRARERERVKR